MQLTYSIMKVLMKFVHLSLMIQAAIIIGLSAQSLIESSNSSVDVIHMPTRRKRFIIFPKGSSLQLVYCFLTTAYGTPGGLFTIGITLGLAWEIPQDPRPYLENSTLGFIHRRHRRDLFPKIEKFLDKYGVNGRSCIFRAICESRHHEKGNGSFAEELLYTLFSFPLLKEAQEDFSSIFDEANHDNSKCLKYRAGCPTSIVDLDFRGTSDASKYLRDDT